MGNEFGAINKPFDEQDVRITMTYPETYEVGMSNTAIPALQYILNQEQGVMCDRAYFPDPDAVEMLARHNKPLFGVESKRPLHAFDALGFSLAYELGGINVLEMLKLGGVPVSSEERMQAEPWDIWNPDNVRPHTGGPKKHTLTNGIPQTRQPLSQPSGPTSANCWMHSPMQHRKTSCASSQHAPPQYQSSSELCTRLIAIIAHTTPLHRHIGKLHSSIVTMRATCDMS